MKNFFGFSLLGLTFVTALQTTFFSPNPTAQAPESYFACNATADAGADTTICNPGEVVTLAGVAGGNVLDVMWFPSTGVADVTQAITTAIVDTTTTYTFVVRSIDDANMIVNGDFSQGNTGFSTDYMVGNSTSQIGILADENAYAIATSPRSVHRSFANCGDHTTGTGNMMVVNASGTSNNVWCQTLTVQPNTDYVFSAWLASATSQNPARLQFSINGNLIGNEFQASATTCNWQEFSSDWNSQAVSTAEICITNVNNTPAGNDFAIDDISFQQVCAFSDEVTVTVANLNADWTNPGPLCQSDTAIDLNSLLEATATTGGSWTIDNTPATRLDPANLMPGDYTLRYTVTTDNCETQNEQTIIIIAGANAGTPAEPVSVCAGTAESIILAERLTGEDFGGIWTETSAVPSVNAAFDALAGTFNTTGQAAGTYEFTYTVASTPPCADVQSTVEVIVLPAPIADAGEDMELNCAVDIVTVGGPMTTTGGNLQYTWTALNGSPIAVPDIPFTEVETADLYILTVFDLETGCNAIDDVTVSSQITTPSATLDVRPVSCNRNDDGTIIVTNVINGEAPFLYALNGGELTEKNEFPLLSPGNYTITIQDQNGCDTTLQAVLAQPEVLVVDLQADIQSEPPVIVQGDSVNLNILFSKPASAIDTIIWMPDSLGCSTCATASVRPMVSSTYTIRVTDENGCIATDEITIFVEQLQRIFVPNAFTPNGDGINDVLYISAAEEIQRIKTFYIVNRWGEMMFSRENFLPNDPDLGWNGQFNGQNIPSGVYVYVAEIELANGETSIISGDITLVN